MSTQTSTFSQTTSVDKLKELCNMFPFDPNFHIQLAERYKQEGHEIQAIVQARKAYDILIKEDPSRAEALVATFGHEINSSDIQPYTAADYSPLAEYFGIINTQLHKMRVKAGTVLFKKGDMSDFIYLVLEGELTVNSDDDNNPSLLNYLHAGALVGENAMEENSQRIATVVAQKHSILLRFTKEELDQAFSAHPDLMMQFSKEKLWRQRLTSLSTSPVFACIPLDLRYMLARRAWHITHQAGTTIKRPHAYMPHVELITQGVVHMYEYETGELPLYCGRIQAGDILGLHKIISGKASRAAYEADTACQAICFDFALIHDLMVLVPKFRTRIRDKAAHFTTQVSRTMTLQNI